MDKGLMLVLSETLKCFDSLLVEISFDDLVVTLVRKLNGARIIIDYYSINIYRLCIYIWNGLC